MQSIDGTSLTLETFAEIVERGETCALSADARARVARARAQVARIAASGDAVYGINTGFGDLASVRIAPDRLRELQANLLLSHAAGVGEPLEPRAVRGMLLLRANALARGHSGVRPEIIDALLGLLNADVLPVVPSRGSVGASGDLAPLAHLALPLIGHGALTSAGQPVELDEGLARAGIARFVLEPKEGLALINGTQAMTSLAALAVNEAHRLARLADLAAALSTDALRGTDAAFDARIHALRAHPGQARSAANLARLLAGSAIRESHRQGDVRVQDPYSVRCVPQVHGAARDLLEVAARTVEIEMNSVTDNPLVFPEAGDVISGGNFHGQPVAFAADMLSLACAELGSISERRIEKLTNTAFSGLPPFLVREPGLNSGFMIAQVTAAALVAENRGLCMPASVDSIPTSADKEDHVSMGMGAALKLHRVIGNLRTILAIELLAGAQGVDLLRPLRSSPVLEEVHAGLRARVPPWDRDRVMAPDIAAAEAFIGTLGEYLDGLD